MLTGCSGSCCPGSVLAAHTGNAHPAWEFVVLGRSGATVAAALSSHSGTSHAGRDDPCNQGRKDAYLVHDLLSRLTKHVGALSPQ